MAPAAERAQHALAAGLHMQAFSLCVTAGDDASIFYERALHLMPGIHEPAQHHYPSNARQHQNLCTGPLRERFTHSGAYHLKESDPRGSR